MKKILLLPFLILTFASCNIGKQYANYRAGGKSNKIESKIIDPALSETEKENRLEEITYLDTLTIKKLPENKTMVVLKEKTIKSNSSLLKTKTNRLSPVCKKKKSTFNKKNNYSKNYSPLKGKNANREIWITIILASLVAGVIVYMISGSLFMAILISVLVAIGISLIIALAICIIVFFVFCLFLELIESL